MATVQLMSATRIYLVTTVFLVTYIFEHIIIFSFMVFNRLSTEPAFNGLVKFRLFAACPTDMVRFLPTG